MRTKGQKNEDTPSKPQPRPTNQGCLEKIFFDVPVYRLTKEKYDLERESFVQREISTGNYYVDEMYRREPTQKERMENHLREIYGGCWLFNEITGFIRLYFCFSQIRGEYWRIDAKKITRTRRKVFTFYGWKVTCEEEIPAGSSNEQILNLILKYLERAQNERYLRRRYIDKSILEYIGPRIDWNGLLKLAQRPTGAGGQA